MGRVTREEFDQLSVALDNNFEVNNHGPGPALVWIDVDIKVDIPSTPDITVNGDGFVPPGPVLMKPQPDRLTFGLRLIATGYDGYETMAGTEYAEVTFRWAAYSQRDVHDETTFALKTGSATIQSAFVNDAILASAFSQPQELVLPGTANLSDGAELAA